MRIISISTQNYRTLESIEIPFSENYCTISGQNNAGKSCIIRLLLNLFESGESPPWVSTEYFKFDYKEDKTQWHKPDDPINICYMLQPAKSDDPALITFIEKITGKQIQGDQTNVKIETKITTAGEHGTNVFVNNETSDFAAGKEIVKKLKAANLMFLYNSTRGQEEAYHFYRGRRFFYDFVLSEDEKNRLDQASREAERRLKAFAREHREDLNNILGRLSERYDVEFSPMERYTTRHMPLGINLKDKTVEVPLNDWGSGTQNRTHILMAILQANRIKTRESAQDKITPIVVVEEPESFLHPSAQSEFGRILCELSTDLGIQIITTTHSPYMLNRQNPSANILLCRDVKRRKQLQTIKVDTSGESWMAPFAQHLGIDNSEFKVWRPIFSSYKSCVLLVEGSIDKDYFDFLKTKDLGIELLDGQIEVQAYGGKDALRNSLLVRFVLSQFDEFFITFDLDAATDVKGTLQRAGLREGNDYIPLGINQPGRDAIEGLLPQRILSAVMGRETDLVMQLGAKDNKDRKEAKDKLKRKYLEEFTNNSDYTREDLKELSKVIKIINNKFNPAKKRYSHGNIMGEFSANTKCP